MADTEYIKLIDVNGRALINAIEEDALHHDARIIWKRPEPRDNVIFLATKQTLIEMIEDTTDPEDMFEIWYPIEIAKKIM